MENKPEMKGAESRQLGEAVGGSAVTRVLRADVRTEKK